jgi:hypothetical protein
VVTVPLDHVGSLTYGDQPFYPHFYHYDQAAYPFARVIGEMLLPWVGAAASDDRLQTGHDQHTIYHRQFYRLFHDRCGALYRAFMLEQVVPLFGEPVCYQSVPTFRIHLPGNVAVGGFHTDAEYGHPIGELNFHLPCTEAVDTSAIWLETGIGSRLYVPMNLVPGQVMAFDAVRWRHGNQTNQTGRTRVSLDFRCLPLARLPGQGSARSVAMGKAFQVGDYYSLP